MEYQTQQFNVMMSTCLAAGHRGGEDLVPEHLLVYRISGDSHVYLGDQVHITKPGNISLVRKNTLLKTIKYPEPDGRPFQAIAIFFDQAMLKKIGNEENIMPGAPYTGEVAIDLSENVFLKGYFESLLPFFKTAVPLSPVLAELKTKEAITLLLQHNYRLKDMLFDFSEPFKIDLEAYMNRNYIYHIPLSQFARLSGRSISTFKRDFKKIFGESPEKWIRCKRLERAHFLITERKQTPVEVYADVGFDSLSHFSVAFKKHYGYNPSTLV